ncbi:hypothetical protein ACWOFR_03495 [Carnobacterium gallinarum]|uniref:hypothetical protein n=1 Tax=Carnobacterium gallinarum TaxID=2749 RepID=UPI00054EE489|nr:hypothetical protein [Carnobacterium gallinarum]
MTYQSKKAILSLVSFVVTFVLLFWRFDLPHLTLIQGWGQFFLLLFVAIGMITIFAYLIFDEIYRILGRNKLPQKKPKHGLFELKALRNFCFVLSVGFFLSMTLLAFGKGLTVLFILMTFSILAAGIIMYTSYIFYYESNHWR